MRGGGKIYPLTTTDQVLKLDGTRLETDNGIDADTVGGYSIDDISNDIAADISNNIAEHVPFPFGIDENGNYGYIKAGADSVTPFKEGRAELLTVLTGGTNSVYPYELSYTFTDSYSQAIIVILSNDTDNNSDNFYKVYSDRNSDIASSNYTNYWNVTKNEWDYFKPTFPNNISSPNVNSKYTNDKDKDKDMFWDTGTTNAYGYSCIAKKSNIKSGDTAWMYINFYRRGIILIFGIK